LDSVKTSEFHIYYFGGGQLWLFYIACKRIVADVALLVLTTWRQISCARMVCTS